MSINPDEIKEKIINRAVLLQIGNETIAIIRERTLAGIFLPGSSPDASQYSSKPFVMPSGKMIEMAGKGRAAAIWKSLQRGEMPGKIFKTKAGAIWVLLQEGYKKFRELSGKVDDTANLNWTGRMMRNLSITKVGADYIEVGFRSDEEEQKAIWHNITGASRSRKKRVFMGLTEKEIDRIIGKIKI